MAPPARQDPIPGSYIRECVTKEGAHRWNVRAYDAATRATVTLGTFGNLAEAKGAYWAHEKKAAAPEKKPSSSPNPPRTKTAPEEAARAKKPTARSKTARKREPVAPPPSAKRAPKKGAVNTPAKKRPVAKGEKRPRAGKAPSEPRAPKRRRSSAATTTTTAMTTTITSPPRTPRDSARMRNLAEAAALATTSANKKLPPKKRGLPSPTNPNLLDTSPRPTTASFGKNHAMKRQSPRLASPRSPRPRRRSKGGHIIWSPQAKPPLRANTAVRQALCDAAADVAHVIAAAAPPPATKDSSSPMTTLGGIARRLSDGLLGLLSSQCGAGGSQRSSGTDATAVLVPVVGGPGWRWSGDADALALAPVANASIGGNDWPLAPNDTGAVDVSVESFGRAMAAAGLSVQHRVRFSLAPSE
jgi:hypothetical protein